MGAAVLVSAFTMGLIRPGDLKEFGGRSDVETTIHVEKDDDEEEESSEDDGDVEAPTTTTTTTSKATGGAIEPMEIDTTTTTIKPRY